MKYTDLITQSEAIVTQMWIFIYNNGSKIVHLKGKEIMKIITICNTNITNFPYNLLHL